jgi:hypothetical protein
MTEKYYFTVLLSSVQKMEAVFSSETSINYCQTILHQTVLSNVTNRMPVPHFIEIYLVDRAIYG